MTNTKLNRRTAMRVVGVGAIATAAGGFVSKSLFAESDTVEKYEDSGHRLYRLADKDPYLQNTLDGLPAPIWVHVGRRNLQKPVRFVWATRDQITKIDASRKEADVKVKPLVVKTVADVTELTAEDGKSGELYVLFCPNAQNDEDANSNSCRMHQIESQAASTTPNFTYESINQIVAKWNESLKGQGVKAVAVKDNTKPPKGAGHAMLNMAGQIKIEFDGKLSEDALNTIKSHPQAVSISHGKPFTTMYCPGCGMG